VAHSSFFQDTVTVLYAIVRHVRMCGWRTQTWMTQVRHAMRRVPADSSASALTCRTWPGVMRPHRAVSVSAATSSTVASAWVGYITALLHYTCTTTSSPAAVARRLLSTLQWQGGVEC